MACTINWQIRGKDEKATLTGESVDGIPFAEVMSQLRTNLSTPEGFEILITNSETGNIIRAGSIPNGATVSVQGVSSVISRKAEAYKSLDDLFKRSPRITVPDETDLNMINNDQVQQTQFPVLAELSKEHNGLYCPISSVLLIDAIIVSCCGNTCSKAAIRADLPCPFCKSDTPELVPDARVRRLAKKHQEEEQAKRVAHVVCFIFYDNLHLLFQCLKTIPPHRPQ